MKWAVVILNYRDYEETTACVKAVFKSKFPVTIFVADNSDDEVEQKKLLKAFPRVRLVRNKANLGFAGGNNKAIRIALDEGFEVVAIVNPDVRVNDDFFVSGEKAFLDNHNLGIYAPGLLHKQNNKKLYGLEGHMDYSVMKATHRNVTKIEDKDLVLSEFVTFACVAIRREVFEKIGLIDERFFMYLEDVDFCLRAISHGFEIGLDPMVICTHKTSSSFSNPIKKLPISYVSQIKFILKYKRGLSALYPLIYQSAFYLYLYCLWSWHKYKKEHLVTKETVYAGEVLNKISLVVLTHESEKRFVFKKEYLSVFDELIGIDDQSKDGTVLRMKSLGFKVFERKLAGDWDEQRNFGMRKASNDWIFFLDDDEYLDDTLLEEIERAKRADLSLFGAGEVMRSDIFQGQLVRFGEHGRMKILRLVNKQKGKFVRGVHERFETTAEIVRLGGRLIHDNKQGLSEMLNKAVVYGEVDSRALSEEGKKWSLVELLKPAAKFLYVYVGKLGFLDGRRGLFLAYFMAVQSMIVRVFQWENAETN